MNENKYNIPKSKGCSKSSPKRGITAIQAYFKKQEKSQMNTLTLRLKEFKKEEYTEPKLKKEIKIRVEINERQTKKTTGKINKQRGDSLERYTH